MAMTRTLMLRLMMVLSATFWLAMLICWFGAFTWKLPVLTLLVGVCLIFAVANILPSPYEVHRRRRSLCIQLRIERRNLIEKLATASADLSKWQLDPALPDLPAELQALVSSRLAAAQAEVSRLELLLDCVETSLPRAEAKLEAINAEIDEMHRQADNRRHFQLCGRA